MKIYADLWSNKDNYTLNLVLKFENLCDIWAIMGVLTSSRSVIYCGSTSWKLASLSSTNTRSRFSSSVDVSKDKDRNSSYSPIFSNSNVSLLKSAILKTRFSSSDASAVKNTGFFGPEAVIDKTGKVNRWSMFVPAFMTHLCKYIKWILQSVVLD